jgi:hypothetical protein
MEPLELINLTSLMKATRGRPEIVIGLIDGPVAVDHPDLTVDHIRQVPGKLQGTCCTGPCTGRGGAPVSIEAFGVTQRCHSTWLWGHYPSITQYANGTIDSGCGFCYF